MSTAAYVGTAAPPSVSIKLIAQAGYSPQIDIGEREGGNPIRFQICAPHQDELVLSHGQLAALVSAAGAWLDRFAPHTSEIVGP